MNTLVTGVLEGGTDLGPGIDPGIVRAACLFLPLFAVVLLAVRTPPSAARIAATILASAWNLAVLPGVNLLAVHFGWWSFHAEGATVAGLPVDVMLGWVLLWGAVPALAGWWNSLAVTVCALVWLDLAVMPLLQPVLRLGQHWLYGEAIAASAALLPALLLARWTERDQRLTIRAVAQMALAGLLMLAVPMAASGVRLPDGPVLGMTLQLLAVPLLLGVAAVREFAVRGRGTALPYDPPRRLVTSGPYAYVRNPMQLSMVLLYLLLSAVTLDPRPLVAVVILVAYSAGLASWHEDEQLRRLHGGDWDRYRSEVRAWLPRTRPWPGHPPARVYVASTCDVCNELGQWIQRHSPVALLVVPAESHPAGLRRITYESGDGCERSQGVAALGRVLQHFNLGWAWLGWTLLIPGVAPAVQLLVDGLGFGPRSIPRIPPPGDPAAGATPAILRSSPGPPVPHVPATSRLGEGSAPRAHGSRPIRLGGFRPSRGAPWRMRRPPSAPDEGGRRPTGTPAVPDR
ncbi:MAG TPA: methyltransferase [Kineosporiaceae bacterium]|nr:methyltransferase [Kineosporiaceae bacterium]